MRGLDTGILKLVIRILKKINGTIFGSLLEQYPSLVKKEVIGSCQTLVDLGCGTKSPVEKFSDKLFEAGRVSPHSKDIPYFALALALDCAIWSGEKRHKEQSQVKVFNTKDLVKKLGLGSILA